MGCPECSQPIPDGARFCPSCGTSLNGATAVDTVTDEERRVVTVLFADIVGFTALAERRDPEQVKRLVDAAFALLVADVESHGGVVDKVLGDAIVALFGRRWRCRRRCATSATTTPLTKYACASA